MDDGDLILYSKDTSNSENQVYRQFEARMFLYDVASSGPATTIDTDVVSGENELQCQFSPSEGGVIFTRVASNFSAKPKIFSLIFGGDIDDDELFTEASMPNWE